MSGPAELNLSPPTSAVRNTVRKENEQISKNLNRPAPDAALREYYDKHYHQLLPIIAEKVHQEKVQQEKLKEVKARWEEKEEESREYVELLWEDFIYQIDNRAYKKNKIGMHTSRDDYLINTLRFVSAKKATQIYGALLPESLTSPEMKETKAYKTYLGFATGATPPKKA
ncbi:hypothetical protein Tco_1547713 [Tanacetum coccineum]